MIRATIYSLNTTTAKDEIAGTITFDGSRIVIQPSAGKFMVLMHNIARQPIAWIQRNGERTEVHPAENPARFVRNLPRQYKGAYLRAQVIE
jgi:hypothetical protein